MSVQDLGAVQFSDGLALSLTARLNQTGLGTHSSPPANMARPTAAQYASAQPTTLASRRAAKPARVTAEQDDGEVQAAVECGGGAVGLSITNASITGSSSV